MGGVEGLDALPNSKNTSINKLQSQTPPEYSAVGDHLWAQGKTNGYYGGRITSK